MSETTRTGRRSSGVQAGNSASTSGQPASDTNGRRRETRSRRGGRLWFLSAPPPPAPREEGLTPFNARGTKLRKPNQQRRAAFGYFAPYDRGAPTSTRQAEILNTAVVASPTQLQAPVLGIERLSEAVVQHDNFLAYDANIGVTSLNSLVVGDVGSGKSSLMKTGYGLRPLLLRDRRCVVFDKKADGDEGEYAELSRVFGSEPLTFSIDGGGVVLNLLDPVITGGVGAQRQLRLLMVAAELAQDAKPLDKWELEGLRSAYRIVMHHAEADRGRVPVLPDVLDALGRIEDDPTPTRDGSIGAYARATPAARERLHEAALGVKFLLNGLLEEYSGIFDGPTSPGVQLGKKLTSFDVSQLPDDGPAVPTVMAIAHNWLLGALKANPGVKTNLIVEEGWHLVAGPAAGLLKNNTKLARARGLALIMAIHKIADIPPDSPAMAVLQEAQVVHVFSQARQADVERCVHDFNLDPAARELIPNLARGDSLFKRGTEPELLLRHVRSELEERLTDTDAAIRGNE